MDNLSNGLCVLLNDSNSEILNKIGEYSTKGHICEHKEEINSKVYSLLVDNKYYSAQIKILAFDNTHILNEWRKKNQQFHISALFICVEIEEITLELFERYKNLFENLSLDIQVIVLKESSKQDTFKYNLLQKFCNDNCLELVELKPDEETKEALEEFQEKYGAQRLWEILGSVDWPQKSMKTNPILLSENRQRLQNYIVGEEENDEEKVGCSTLTTKISVAQKATEIEIASKDDFLSSIESNIEDLKNMDLVSTIELFNKFKDQLSNLSREERVNMAAKIALNILDSEEEEDGDDDDNDFF